MQLLQQETMSIASGNPEQGKAAQISDSLDNEAIRLVTTYLNRLV